MRKQLPIILLAMICIVLVVALQRQRQQIGRMAQTIADLEAAPAEQSKRIQTPSVSEKQAELVQHEVNEDFQPQKKTPAPAETPAPEVQSAKESTRRIMRSMAKTIDENPTINKMVEASQRGAVGALYSDMIEYLDLNADETNYFMELLMYRQMAHVDMHMKIASGSLTEEEQSALQEKTRLANETTRLEMETFLNSPKDFEEFKFYEDTIGERMMLSQMDQMLGGAALSKEAYREVLQIMYDERETYTWSTDLHDSESTDLSPERFSEDNISRHLTDMKALGERMDRRMQEILTPEQLAAWRESGAAMQALIEGQLTQANQAFGGN
ncbi:MAG: hypothetical protein KJN98_04230 [Pontiella sp.]|nr:hypothetical protein [Pontiella sp.]